MTNLAEIARQVGASHRNLCEVKRIDAWDEFAGRVWSAENAGGTGTSVRTAKQQAMVYAELERRQATVIDLTREAERITEAMKTESPGSKLHLALISALEKTNRLLADATGLDLASFEAKQRIIAVCKAQGERPPIQGRIITRPDGTVAPAQSEGRIVAIEPVEAAPPISVNDPKENIEREREGEAQPSPANQPSQPAQPSPAGGDEGVA